MIKKHQKLITVIECLIFTGIMYGFAFAITLTN